MVDELLAEVGALLGLGKPLPVVVRDLGFVVFLRETLCDQRIMTIW